MTTQKAPPPQVPIEKELRIMTFNIFNFNYMFPQVQPEAKEDPEAQYQTNQAKVDAIVGIVQNEDIVIFQEVANGGEHGGTFWQSLWTTLHDNHNFHAFYPTTFTDPGEHSVVILWKNTVTKREPTFDMNSRFREIAQCQGETDPDRPGVVTVPFPFPHRIVGITFEIGTDFSNLLVIGAHLKKNDATIQGKQRGCMKAIKQQHDGYVIIAGDMNNDRDFSRYFGPPPPERARATMKRVWNGVDFIYSTAKAPYKMFYTGRYRLGNDPINYMISDHKSVSQTFEIKAKTTNPKWTEWNDAQQEAVPKIVKRGPKKTKWEPYNPADWGRISYSNLYDQYMDDTFTFNSNGYLLDSPYSDVYFDNQYTHNLEYIATTLTFVLLILSVVIFAISIICAAAAVFVFFGSKKYLNVENEYDDTEDIAIQNIY